MKRVVIYARVSREEQNQGDAVSIPEQLSDMRNRCAVNDWTIYCEYIDDTDYLATQSPFKGKNVNPSGERADRPHFLEMLELIKSGDIDAIVCWRDDRLVRHPRVAVAMEDAFDIGDARRIGREKIQIYDATGAMIDRFTLSIKATIWREENKRRVERTRMGKSGTLKAGRWPGHYIRFGYRSYQEQGRRGRVIELDTPDKVQTVKDIFNWREKGLFVAEIRDRLIARGDDQGNLGKNRKYDWGTTNIEKILRSEDYTGKATWYFSDGTSTSIEIPQIIPVEQFKRVQAMIDKNIRLSTRNAKRCYVLQGLIKCGVCGSSIVAREIHYYYKKMKDGSMKRYDRPHINYSYCCEVGQRPMKHDHPRPVNWSGVNLEWAVWRKLVDDGIKQPEHIQNQIRAKQERLQKQGDSIDGDIAQIRLKIKGIEEERASYQRQLARKKISEAEYDARMDETAGLYEDYNKTLSELQELRDSRDKVQVGLNYVNDLLRGLQVGLPAIDQNPCELKELPFQKQQEISKYRQKVVRALVDKIILYGDNGVIQGVLDGDEGMQFDLLSSRTCAAGRQPPPTCQVCNRARGCAA